MNKAAINSQIARILSDPPYAVVDTKVLTTTPGLKGLLPFLRKDSTFLVPVCAGPCNGCDVHETGCSFSKKRSVQHFQNTAGMEIVGVGHTDKSHNLWRTIWGDWSGKQSDPKVHDQFQHKRVIQYGNTHHANSLATVMWFNKLMLKWLERNIQRTIRISIEANTLYNWFPLMTPLPASHLGAQFSRRAPIFPRWMIFNFQLLGNGQTFVFARVDEQSLTRLPYEVQVECKVYFMQFPCAIELTCMVKVVAPENRQLNTFLVHDDVQELHGSMLEQLCDQSCPIPVAQNTVSIPLPDLGDQYFYEIFTYPAHGDVIWHRSADGLKAEYIPHSRKPARIVFCVLTRSLKMIHQFTVDVDCSALPEDFVPPIVGSIPPLSDHDPQSPGPEPVPATTTYTDLPITTSGSVEQPASPPPSAIREETPQTPPSETERPVTETRDASYDPVQLQEELTHLHSLESLRSFIDRYRLPVRKDVGGKQSRRKTDVQQDAMKHLDQLRSEGKRVELTSASPVHSPSSVASELQKLKLDEPEAKPTDKRTV